MQVVAVASLVQTKLVEVHRRMIVEDNHDWSGRFDIVKVERDGIDSLYLVGSSDIRSLETHHLGFDGSHRPAVSSPSSARVSRLHSRCF